MAKKSQKRWVYSPKSAPKPKVSDAIKQAVKEQCDEFVETILKPNCIHPPPENMQFNYIVDLYTLWYRNFFYFCAKYHCPAPNCISEYFEVRYTRLEYVTQDSYNMAYMRHTGKWQVVFYDQTLNECLALIKTEEIFRP